MRPRLHSQRGPRETRPARAEQQLRLRGAEHFPDRQSPLSGRLSAFCLGLSAFSKLLGGESRLLMRGGASWPPRAERREPNADNHAPLLDWPSVAAQRAAVGRRLARCPALLSALDLSPL